MLSKVIDENAELDDGTSSPAATATQRSPFVGYSHFAGRRKNFIAAQLAAQAAPPQHDKDSTSTHGLINEPIFFVHKHEEEAAGININLLAGCGLVEIDDESRHGEQVGNTLYNSFRDNEPIVEDIVDQGAYDEYSWSELPPHVQKAAIILGYDEVAWNEGYDIPTTEKKWDQLTEQEQVAASKLGYNKDFWNHSHSAKEVIDTSHLHDSIRGFDTFRAVLRCNKESRKIAKIAIPTTIENMTGTLFNAIQLAYISKHIGTDALVAFGMIDFALSFTEIIGGGLDGASEVMIAQFIGGGDNYRAGATVQLSVFLYMVVAIPTYTIWILFIGDLCQYLGFGNDVAHLAQVYLPIVSLSHLVSCFSGSLVGLLSIDGKVTQVSLIDTVFGALETAAIVLGIVEYNIGLVEVAWLEVVFAVVYGLFMFSLCSCRGWLDKFKEGLTDLGALGNKDLLSHLVRSAVPLCVTEFLGEGEWHILAIFGKFVALLPSDDLIHFRYVDAIVACRLRLNFSSFLVARSCPKSSHKCRRCCNLDNYSNNLGDI